MYTANTKGKHMSDQTNSRPLTFFSQPIVFVESYEQAKDVVERMSSIKEFFILTDNSSRPSSAVNAVFKSRKGRVFRIRPSGSWNTLLRALGDVDADRVKGGYGESTDLMFISLLTAHDVSSALKRHRAVAHLSCREMYFLDTISYPVSEDDSIDLALRCMPSIPAPVQYQHLTVEQRFALSGFEFARFMRPIHCVNSVGKMQECRPFYTTDLFGPTFQAVGCLKPNVGTVGHIDHGKPRMVTVA